VSCGRVVTSHVYSATGSPVYRPSAAVLLLDLDVILLHPSVYTVAIVVVIVSVIIVSVVIIIVVAVV
jgi:hypothetical protein